MSIGQGLTLVTGPTGSGKSAWIVARLMELEGKRPIFVMGIPELKVDHAKVPPVDEWVEQRPDEADPSLLLPYFTFTPGALVVLDEAQRVFRPRPVGSKVPPAVAAFETRRHTGCDFVLLTQNVGLLDPNVRRLVNRHIHIHVTFLGSFVLEWPGLGDPETKASRDLASRQRYKPDKATFAMYKSAEIHTKIVRKRPWQVYALAVLLPLAVALGWNVYDRVSSRNAPVTQALGGAPIGGAPGVVGVAPRAAAPQQKPVTAGELVASFKPRLEGLVHTAPRYDALTVAVAVPVPAGCIKSAQRCKCYNQRGTEYPTTDEVCRQIVASYLFLDFQPDVQASENRTLRDVPGSGSREPDVSPSTVSGSDRGSSSISRGIAGNPARHATL